MKTVHSVWAIVVLIALITTFVNAILGIVKKKEFDHKGFRLGLLTLISTHTQFLIGITWYFMSPWFSALISTPKAVIKTPETRLLAIEHPLMMILMVVVVTMGWSKHKKQAKSSSKFKTFAIFYGIALLIALSRIPWSNWI